MCSKAAPMAGMTMRVVDVVALLIGRTQHWPQTDAQIVSSPARA